MKRRMSYRQRIDASHEARLWIKDVVIPGITALVIIDRVNPMLKYNIGDTVKKKVDNLKEKLNTRKNKEP